MATSYQDDTRSLEVLNNITKGLDFTIPNIDFNDPSLTVPAELLAKLQRDPTTVSRDTITKIDAELFKSSNSHTITGTGTFDLFMDAYQKHLEREFKEKRILGSDYANAYTTLLSKAMDQAIQFELSKDKAYWDGILSQLQAITAICGIYKAKVELAIAQAQALLNKAQYAEEVAKLGVLDAQYGNAIANTDKTREEINLVTKQEGLVSQQTTSYKRRDEYSAVKLQADAFSIQKSVDEGTVAPPVFQSSAINNNISKHLANVGL